jgi:hypothetical protein
MIGPPYGWVSIAVDQSIAMYPDMMWTIQCYGKPVDVTGGSTKVGGWARRLGMQGPDKSAMKFLLFSDFSKKILYAMKKITNGGQCRCCGMPRFSSGIGTRGFSLLFLFI